MKTLSLLGVALMAAGLATLVIRREVFSPSPVAIGLQIAAAPLMLWARVTFGARSFHAAANPSAGALVTAGPYHHARHPIYTAVCVFTWAGVAANAAPVPIALGLAVTAGAIMRMHAEERLLIGRYPEYVSYMNATRRVIPFLY